MTATYSKVYNLAAFGVTKVDRITCNDTFSRVIFTFIPARFYWKHVFYVWLRTISVSSHTSHVESWAFHANLYYTLLPII